MFFNVFLLRLRFFFLAINISPLFRRKRTSSYAETRRKRRLEALVDCLSRAYRVLETLEGIPKIEDLLGSAQNGPGDSLSTRCHPKGNKERRSTY